VVDDRTELPVNVRLAVYVVVTAEVDVGINVCVRVAVDELVGVADDVGVNVHEHDNDWVSVLVDVWTELGVKVRVQE